MTANKPLVGTLMTIGDVTVSIAIAFFITCFGKRENLGRSNDAKRSKTGIALAKLRGQKRYAMPTNGDHGQTSNWSKLEAAYLPDLPVARLTILDRLVL